jgi:membrane-bound serine protease (ClpP class)
VKRTLKDWLIFFGLLADEAAAAGLVLLVLWAFDISIPIWIAVVLALALGGIAFVFHRSVIPSFHRKRVTGAEAMVGLSGEVIEPLQPVGVVRVKGEYWKAESENGEVPAGKTVEVSSVKGLVLRVRRRE